MNNTLRAIQINSKLETIANESKQREYLESLGFQIFQSLPEEAGDGYLTAQRKVVYKDDAWVYRDNGRWTVLT